jgi:hypothetical protein
MTSISLEKSAAALCLSLVMVACGPSDEASRAKAGPIVGHFLVSNFFTPSGFMGDGAIPNRMTVGINENCKQPRPAGAQGDCYHFLYHVGDVKWAGAYWVYPTNSWGSVPGHTLVPPIDVGPNPNGGELRRYTRVRFFGAMDKLPNDPFVQFYAGGIDGRKATPPQPYFDHGCQLSSSGNPPICTDSDGKTPFFFSATDGGRFNGEWQQFTLDLSSWSLDSLIGAFGWASNDTDNPGVTQSIYIDDIVWE